MHALCLQLPQANWTQLKLKLMLMPEMTKEALKEQRTIAGKASAKARAGGHNGADENVRPVKREHGDEKHSACALRRPATTLADSQA